MIKKIAIITHYWKESQGGGVRNYIIGLVNELKKMNMPTMVIFEKGDRFDLLILFTMGFREVDFFLVAKSIGNVCCCIFIGVGF